METNGIQREEIVRDDAIRINERIDDWVGRIKILYDDIESWTSSSNRYDTLRTRHVLMSEELMRVNNIPQRELDILDIRLGENIILSFKPHGLWIIGANGRFDVIGRDTTWILVDQSKPFSSKQKWIIYSRSSKDKGAKFSKSYFKKILII